MSRKEGGRRSWERTERFSATIYVRTTRTIHRAAISAAREAKMPLSRWVEDVIAKEVDYGDTVVTHPRVAGKGTSGVIFVRTSPVLHDLAVRRAREEEVSISDWVVLLIQKRLAVGNGGKTA